MDPREMEDRNPNTFTNHVCKIYDGNWGWIQFPQNVQLTTVAATNEKNILFSMVFEKF